MIVPASPEKFSLYNVSVQSGERGRWGLLSRYASLRDVLDKVDFLWDRAVILKSTSGGQGENA